MISFEIFPIFSVSDFSNIIKDNLIRRKSIILSKFYKKYAILFKGHQRH